MVTDAQLYLPVHNETSASRFERISVRLRDRTRIVLMPQQLTSRHDESSKPSQYPAIVLVAFLTRSLPISATYKMPLMFGPLNINVARYR